MGHEYKLGIELKSCCCSLNGMASFENVAVPPEGWAKNPFVARLFLFFCRKKFKIGRRLLGTLLNCDLACAIPDDFRIPHPYGIVIHSGAIIGNHAVIMHQVTIGAVDLDNLAPNIGTNVYIGAGAKILGNVRIGDNCVIGANAVITRDVPDGCTVVGANRLIKRAAPAPNPTAPS
jgi:serine O-acetyltransferase